MYLSVHYTVSKALKAQHLGNRLLPSISKDNAFMATSSSIKYIEADKYSLQGTLNYYSDLKVYLLRPRGMSTKVE